MPWPLRCAVLAPRLLRFISRWKAPAVSRTRKVRASFGSESRAIWSRYENFRSRSPRKQKLSATTATNALFSHTSPLAASKPPEWKDAKLATPLNSSPCPNWAIGPFTTFFWFRANFHRTAPVTPRWRRSRWIAEETFPCRRGSAGRDTIPIDGGRQSAHRPVGPSGSNRDRSIPCARSRGRARAECNAAEAPNRSRADDTRAGRIRLRGRASEPRGTSSRSRRKQRSRPAPARLARRQAMLRSAVAHRSHLRSAAFALRNSVASTSRIARGRRSVQSKRAHRGGGRAGGRAGSPPVWPRLQWSCSYLLEGNFPSTDFTIPTLLS